MKKYRRVIIVLVIYISGIPFAYKMTRKEFQNLDGRTCIPGGMTSWAGVAFLSLAHFFEWTAKSSN